MIYHETWHLVSASHQVPPQSFLARERQAISMEGHQYFNLLPANSHQPQIFACLCGGPPARIFCPLAAASPLHRRRRQGASSPGPAPLPIAAARSAGSNGPSSLAPTAPRSSQHPTALPARAWKAPSCFLAAGHPLPRSCLKALLLAEHSLTACREQHPCRRGTCLP